MLTLTVGSEYQRQLYELSLLTQCTIEMRIQVCIVDDDEAAD